MRPLPGGTCTRTSPEIETIEEILWNILATCLTATYTKIWLPQHIKQKNTDIEENLANHWCIPFTSPELMKHHIYIWMLIAFLNPSMGHSKCWTLRVLSVGHSKCGALMGMSLKSVGHSKVYSPQHTSSILQLSKHKCTLKSETNKEIQIQEFLEEFQRDDTLVLWEQETPVLWWPPWLWWPP